MNIKKTEANGCIIATANTDLIVLTDEGFFTRFSY
ncbi:hypothetical protein SRABI134_00468 [Peribacillus sp. Bi134]|nr:hypothetical protein SRABI134_00468 [Peribacillus sp. Bi134]